jgi:hypothetical protein
LIYIVYDIIYSHSILIHNFSLYIFLPPKHDRDKSRSRCCLAPAVPAAFHPVVVLCATCATTRCNCSNPKPYRGAEGTNPTCERMRSKLKQPLTTNCIKYSTLYKVLYKPSYTFVSIHGSITSYRISKGTIVREKYREDSRKLAFLPLGY